MAMLLSPQQIYNILAKTSDWLIKNYPKFSGINAIELTNWGFAVAKTESRSFNTEAQNQTSTARGLMQVLEGTKKGIEEKILKIPVAPVEKMFDPEYNVKIGLAYLAYQFAYYKDWRKSVIAYHLGGYNEKYKLFSQGLAYYDTVNKFYNSTDFIALSKEVFGSKSLFKGIAFNILPNYAVFFIGGGVGIILLYVYKKFIIK